MQTAAQNNLLQVGHSELVLTPSQLPKIKTKPITRSEVWALRDLRLPAAQAIEHIRAQTVIPDEDKDWIIRKIEKSGFAGVIVDCQEHCHQGATVMHGSVAKLY